MTMHALRLFFPFAVLGGVFLAFYTSGDSYYFWVNSPTSMLEMTTGSLLLLTLTIALPTLFLPQVKENKVLRRWLLAYAFAVFYFLGEDQNWGQYYFQWEAPEFFLEHNKEKETNLHNMSSWFNQKPRFVMEMWVIIAGILVPLGWEKPCQLVRRFVPDIFWPDCSLTPMAVLTIAVTMPERLWQWFGIELNPDWQTIRFSELQEFCFAYYMLLYMWFLYRRIKFAFEKS